MPDYMLDTNIISALSRNPTGSIYKCIERVGPERIVISVFTKAEVLYGCEKNTSEKLLTTMLAIMNEMRVLIPIEDIAGRYARLRHHLHQNGNMIGANDLWIASHALCENAVIVTANEREFRRVPGLVVENWSDPSFL